MKNAFIKRFFSSIIAGAVMLSAAAGPGSAVFALDQNENIVYPTGKYNITRAEAGGISFTDQAFRIPSETSISLNSYYGTYSYNCGNYITSSQKYIYDQMVGALAEDPGAESVNIQVPEQYAGDVFGNINAVNDDVKKAFVALVMDYPEYVGLSNIKLSVSSVTPTVVNVSLVYCSGQSSGDTARSSYAAVNSRISSVVSSASAYSSQYEKIKFFAEYLCDNVTYDQAAAASGEGDNCWNAYGALINGSCVCEGYAEAFKLLCDAVSVPCILAVSSNHEWNLVYMDGIWYTVDVTWMDGYRQNGKYDYDWFMAGTDKVNANDQNNSHVLSDSAVLYGCHILKYPAISSSDYEYVPSVPSGKTIPEVSVTPTAGGAYVSWEEISGAGMYWLYVYGDGGVAYQTGVTGTSHSVSGLTPGNSYGFLVISNINGVWSFDDWTYDDIAYAVIP